MNKLQRILCMVLSAILLLTWMPSLAEEAENPAPEAETAAETAEGEETEPSPEEE